MKYIISALIGAFAGAFTGYIIWMVRGRKVRNIYEDDWEDK